MNRTLKTVVFWLVLGVSALLLWEVVKGTQEGRVHEISYSRFLSEVDAGNVASVTISGQQIRGWFREGRESFNVVGPSSPSVYLDALRAKNVEIRFQDTQNSSLPLTLLGTWAPLIMLGALWFFMIRQMQRRKQNNGAIPPGSGNMGPSAGPSSLSKVTDQT